MQGQRIIGGQAVIEGVLMRSPNAYAVSVRRPDGNIESRSGLIPRSSHPSPLLTRPVIRGVAVLVQSLALGIWAFNFSALVQRDETPGAGHRGAAGASARDILFAIGANLGLFIFVPFALTHLAFGAFGAVDRRASFALVEGLARILVFLLTVATLSRLGGMQRMLEYHGAEHKAIIAYESTGALSVEAARPERRQHARCGTSFLTVVMLVAAVLFPVIQYDSFAANALARALLIPVVAGLSYEIVRAATHGPAGRLLRPLVLPGIWLQRITTREPSDDQLEVALHALRSSLALESGGRWPATSVQQEDPISRRPPAAGYEVS